MGDGAVDRRIGMLRKMSGKERGEDKTENRTRKRESGKW